MSSSFNKKPIKPNYYQPKPLKTFSSNNKKPKKGNYKKNKGRKKTTNQKIFSFIFNKKTLSVLFVLFLILAIIVLIFISIIKVLVLELCLELWLLILSTIEKLADQP